jgi:acetolactate synthase-1/2/3 large subunit
MKAVEAIAEILKREGIDMILGYPVNHVLEYAARADIRSIICRQERIGLHMADAISRVTSGDKLGVFAMQHGPGSENAFGGVAQAYGESSPILVLPMGYAAKKAHVHPNFNSTLNFQHVTKSVEPLINAAEVPHAFRRAFTQLRSGRGGPVMIEIPSDIMMQDMPGDLVYTPTKTYRYGPDPRDIDRVAAALVEAKRPVLYAGQGVHYAKAWDALKRLAEMLAAPVTSSLGGKSAFPEGHDLALGSGGRSMPAPVHHFLQKADLIFGIGCSFTDTNFGVKMPAGKKIIHATLDPTDINKDVIAADALIGDAGLILQAVNEAVADRLKGKKRESGAVKSEIADIRKPWLEKWSKKLKSDQTPLSPYRVIWDLANTVDRANTIITHDAGSPRDQLSPFWQSDTPLSYIGWGKTTQLGYGLGLALGAKLAQPDKLCINVWGDAAIGFTGMDFETAVRERIPILSILLNNFSMAIELKVMPVSTEKYRSTDISGDYAAMARAFGGYGERVEKPGDIVAAIKRGIAATQNGQAALLEFITSKEVEVSRL